MAKNGKRIDRNGTSSSVGDEENENKSQRYRSGIFRCFAVITLIVSVINIFYHEFYHEEDIAKIAEDVFRRSHFRTSTKTESNADIGGSESNTEVTSGNASRNAEKQNIIRPSDPALSIPASPSELAGLRCEEHGGPSDPSIAAEMVYWDDIPSDSEFMSPFHPMHSAEDGHWEEKYLTFEPDKGGWNNIRMAMETVLVLGAAMGRTIVLPPEKGMYLLKKGQGKQKNTFTFEDFFELDSVAAEHKGVSVITMEEFLIRKRGKLYHQSSKQLMEPRMTNWNGKNLNDLWAYLRSVAPILSWNPKTCVAAIPASPDPADEEAMRIIIDDIVSEKHGPKPKPEDFTGKPTPVNATTTARLAELLGERKEICLYEAKLQAEPVLHIKDEPRAKARLLTHSYTFIFFQDWRHDLWSKRFVRDHIRYVDEIVCAAARIVNAVRERARKRDEKNNPDGLYDSFHVRRGEFQYKKTRVEAHVLLEKSKDQLQEGGTLYIATDERDKKFFKPLAEHYDVCYLDDFMEYIPGINTNYYGMLDQLVASRGRVFFGTFFSSLSGYVNRMGGYHSQKHKLPGWEDGNIQSYYFVPDDRKFHMTEYRSPKLPLYMMEFPTAWRQIDQGIKELNDGREEAKPTTDINIKK